MHVRRGTAIALLCVLALGCRNRGKGEPGAPFRLGFFPNLTHAQALVGETDGTFARALGDNKLVIHKFNAGPEAMQALLAGELDAAYVGSGPAINAYVQSKGALQVIAGAASGGAGLVTRQARKPEDLRGKKIATPQMGNTQDIALRFWLEEHGLKPSSGGVKGDVQVTPVPNSDALNLFRRGDIEGAWVPEPWAARLIAEGGHLMVDERELWEGGQFPTTLLVASKKALENRKDDLLALLRAHVALTRAAQADPQAFAIRANAALEKLTRVTLPENVLKDAFSRIAFTFDPMQPQLEIAAQHAHQLGFLPNADVSQMVNADLLRTALGLQRSSIPPQARPPLRSPGTGRAQPTK